MGETDSVNHIIHYANNAPSQIELANTILHELGHAITEMHQIKFTDEAQEEHVVASYTNGLFTILRDNPELFVWLLHSIHEPTMEYQEDE